jgi:hypothetical protein
VGIEESRRLFADVRSLRRWVLVMTVVMVALLLATAGMVTFSLSTLCDGWLWPSRPQLLIVLKIFSTIRTRFI